MEARSPDLDIECSKEVVEAHEGIRKLRQRGRYQDAIKAAEESLYQSVVSHGRTSRSTRTVAADLVLAYNHLGMKMLSENNIKVGH